MRCVTKIYSLYEYTLNIQHVELALNRNVKLKGHKNGKMELQFVKRSLRRQNMWQMLNPMGYIIHVHCKTINFIVNRLS
jgi:hypothetical protein